METIQIRVLVNLLLSICKSQHYSGGNHTIILANRLFSGLPTRTILVKVASSMLGFTVKQCSPFVLSGVVDNSFKWIARRKSKQAQTHQTHDVWPGKISLVASTCPACFVEYLKGLVHMRYSLNEFTG
jgi:hypothetical protein